MVPNIRDGMIDIESRDINYCMDYLEEPVICLAPVIPWVRQRSVNRDLVTDILVERVVLTKYLCGRIFVLGYIFCLLCVTQSTSEIIFLLDNFLKKIIISLCF